ncbi:MAG: tRNA (cytidine(34)-2'-O)-methyltransferase [Myxococcales bacterium]|nr:MAG: tRNA (cytidine(34)-2'-O)-methyltransferase [Myxococcales bacterium]
MKVVLVEPEIPPNTGSIARLCAGMKIPLHLVEPLGFSLDDRYLKRAGLDYWPHVDLTVHPSWESFLAKHGHEPLWLTTKTSERPYTTVRYAPDDVLVFGRETVGLGPEILDAFPDRRIGIPIVGKIRSYNLSNAVSIVLFEALRQTQPELFLPPP